MLSIRLSCILVSFFQNLSSWKSRRQSQRKSDEEGEDEGRGVQQQPQPQPQTSYQQPQRAGVNSTLSLSHQKRFRNKANRLKTLTKNVSSNLFNFSPKTYNVVGAV